MARRDALSTWLQQTVSVAAKKDLEAAKLSKSHSKETLANLSGGDVGQACAGLQARGQHRAALLVAQVGGGGEAARMLNQIGKYVRPNAPVGQYTYPNPRPVLHLLFPQTRHL